jgi:putative PIN family toxin of toxin-antitoxin system
MKIVIDTNIVISGTFFGGFPRKILEAVVRDKVEAYANTKIINEYLDIVKEMITDRGGNLDVNILSPFIDKLNVVKPMSKIKISRDKDDDKFIECAIDSNALYVVSGDKDLLDIVKYQRISIIAAKDFYNLYLGNHKKNKTL